MAIAADITVGWSVLVQFLLDRGAISTERADQIWQWAMGGLAAQLRAQGPQRRGTAPSSCCR